MPLNAKSLKSLSVVYLGGIPIVYTLVLSLLVLQSIVFFFFFFCRLNRLHYDLHHLSGWFLSNHSRYNERFVLVCLYMSLCISEKALKNVNF